MVAIHDGAGETVLAGQRILAGLDVEEASEIAGIHRLREEFVAQSQVERQFPADFPVVLHEAACIKAALPSPIEHGSALHETWISQQEIGERQPRSGSVAA